MIVGVVWKGAGILVLPVVVFPLFTSVMLEHALFPERSSLHHWLPGASLLVSAVALFLLNRHLEMGPQSPARPSLSGEYAKYARKLTTDAESSKVRSTRRFSADNDLGWFMFIPTSVWPFIIGAIGLFMTAGNVVASVAGAGK